jgi:hypothetical protein
MATPNQIVNDGFPFGIFTFTYALSGVYATDEAIAAANGKVVALDTSAPGTVKLAGDGDAIFGRVYVAERRAVLGINVASVARKFKERVPVAAGYDAPAVGDRVIGGGNGTVKKATANAGAGAPSDPVVIEVGNDYVIVEFL